MSASVSQKAVPPAIEPELGGLPGHGLQHDLQFDLACWTDWGPVADALRQAGAEVETLRLFRIDGAFVCRCRVTGISPAQGRALVTALLEGGFVAGARIEHLLLREAAL